MLLCDFHIHTTHSDGRLHLPQVVDLYGQSGFDVIAITDHVVNGDSGVGVVANRLHLSLREETFPAYLEEVRHEAVRALERYGMLVIPGLEITKDYLSADRSAHLLLIDVDRFYPASWDYEAIFRQARRHDVLTVACHPHRFSGPMEKNTLHFWNNRRKYAPHIDAWEVANRDDVFNVVSLKRYPYIANSDFHRPRHLYSWKTLLECDKEVAAVKRCIRDNRGVAITLFREA
jgi:hypothetical protein